MKLFWNYLWGKRRQIGAFLLCQGLYAGVLLLYQVPWEVAAYPGALCAGVGLAALGAGYLRFYRRHRELESLAKAVSGAADFLPQPDNTLEADYQALILGLSQCQRDALNRRDRQYREMLDYFTAWAHQIKTPISAMDLRLQQEDSAFSRQLAGELNRIEQYVQMAMTYLRLDSDTTDYCFREQELDDIVSRSLRRFAGEFISRKLRLRYEKLNIRVVTDEKWLGFVVEQVLSNALKYTPTGEIRIYQEAPATLCIADTGIGIAPEDLPRIFEKGYTGFNGRSDCRATGLGLYLCRRILNNLGHEISAASAPGEGCTIRIELSQRRLDGE